MFACIVLQTQTPGEALKSKDAFVLSTNGDALSMHPSWQDFLENHAMGQSGKTPVQPNKPEVLCPDQAGAENGRLPVVLGTSSTLPEEGYKGGMLLQHVFDLQRIYSSSARYVRGQEGLGNGFP